MLDKYLEIIYTSSNTSVLNNLILVPFKYLQKILSLESFTNIADILTPVLYIGMILYVVYIALSFFQFVTSLIFKAKFKLNVLISTLISLFILYTLYVSYQYLIEY